MLPEVRVLLERARSARLSLDGLFDVLPADYWSRAETGSRWDVRDQLAHIASADGMLRDLLRAVASGQPVVWVGGTEDAAEFLARREAPLAELVAPSTRPPAHPGLGDAGCDRARVRNSRHRDARSRRLHRWRGKPLGRTSALGTAPVSRFLGFARFSARGVHPRRDRHHARPLDRRPNPATPELNSSERPARPGFAGGGEAVERAWTEKIHVPARLCAFSARCCALTCVPASAEGNLHGERTATHGNAPPTHVCMAAVGGRRQTVDERGGHLMERA